MYHLLKSFTFSGLQIPGYIRQEFLQEAVRKNNFSLQIICAIIFAAEFFNLLRVLVWSSSGLTTQNNRIYFAMYCILIFLGVLWLVLRRLLRQSPIRHQWLAQYALTILMLFWHIVLNTYDLHRDSHAGTTVLTTALLALALLIQSPPWYSAAQFAACYGIFQAMMAPLLDEGDRLNLTIAFVVALAVSLTYAHHTCVALQQQKQILEMNARLQQLAQLDPLTGLLNKATMECRARQLLHGLNAPGSSGGLTLFLLDLDEFKVVNDRYGHPCGDHVLTQTAASMRTAFPDAAGLGRTGGDEFAVLYDCPVTESQARALEQRLRQELQKIQWQNQPVPIRCSMGVCICTLAQCSYQRLYSETDRMLYQAKKTGKGRCCVQRLEPTEAGRHQAADV